MQRHSSLSHLLKTNASMHRDAVIAISIVLIIATCYLLAYLVMAVANVMAS
jgi:hypothetical protein